MALNTTLVFLPGKSLGWRSLAGHSPWGRKRAGQDLATKQQHSSERGKTPVAEEETDSYKYLETCSGKGKEIILPVPMLCG